MGNTYKKLSFWIILTSLFVTPLFSEDYQLGVIGPFNGLNNTDNSLIIPSNQAQDLLNVDVSLGGKSIKKRDGYGTAFTLTDSTSGVHGIYNFYNSAGSDVSLFFNGSDLSSSVSGAADEILFSTGPADATYQCDDSDGYAYCVNTNRTTITKTDGDTYSSITTVNSTGTMVAVTPERLVTSGFSSEPTRIDFSKSNDFSTWTIGSAGTDPAQFYVTSPGARITHITYAHDRLYWFKESSFGYIIIGQAPAQEDWQIVTVNNFVGNYYNTSIFRNDILYFQASDGHYYAWDGANLVKLSRDIQESLSLTQSQILNSWTETSQSDWNDGVSDTHIYVDTETVSGNVQTLFPDTFSSYRDGSGGTRLVWYDVTDVGSPVVAISGGKLSMRGSLSGNVAVGSQYRLQSFSSGVTYYYEIHEFGPNTFPSPPNLKAFAYFTVHNSTISNFSSVPSTLDSNKFQVIFEDVFSSTAAQLDTLFIGTITTSFSTILPYPLKVQLYVSSNSYRLTVNDVSYANGSHAITPFIPFVTFSHQCGSELNDLVVDNFTVNPQTFTFSSAVNNAPNLTSWGNLEVTKNDGGGTHTFSMRSSTNSFTSTDTTPAWTTQTSGSPITISTGTYFQFRDYFNYTSTNAVMELNDFTVNWEEGGADDKTYAIYHDDALWWSVAGQGSSTNNRIHKYDLVNNGWFIYDIPMNGMLVRNQDLYFGDPSAGKIYQFGSANSDNGTAIEAYWKSKDFFIDSPFLDKDFRNISISAKSQSGSTLDIDYTLNGTTTTTVSWDMTNNNSEFTHLNKNLPQGKVGRTINIQVGNDAADELFEVFMMQYGYRSKSWVPN